MSESLSASVSELKQLTDTVIESSKTHRLWFESLTNRKDDHLLAKRNLATRIMEEIRNPTLRQELASALFIDALHQEETNDLLRATYMDEAGYMEAVERLYGMAKWLIKTSASRG